MKEPMSMPLESLQAKHRELDLQIRHLERRAHLTPTEQQHAVVLKKQKLATKDRIFALRPGAK